MADGVSADVFAGVLVTVVLAWLASTVLAFRAGASRGHTAGARGAPLSSALRSPCASPASVAASYPAPTRAPDRQQDSIVIEAKQDSPPPGRRTRAGVILPPLRTGGEARGSLDRAGARSHKSSSVSVPAAASEGRGALSSRGQAADDDLSHVDDGHAIVQQLQAQAKRKPLTEDEEMEREFHKLTCAAWSQVHLLKKCGEGTFGTVYRADYLGTDVAVKLANDDIIDSPGFDVRFRRECAILSQLHHPNIVGVVAVIMEAPRRKFAIVTDFCPNGDLMSFITAPLEVHRSLDVTYGIRMMIRFCLDIARACRFLHTRAHVIQRDLKLANVLVNRFCNALLADFGLSRMVRGDPETGRPLTPCGSPAWTAPEIVLNKPYTNKVDVYSFGIMMWQLLTREEPYIGRENNLDLAFDVAEHGLRPKVPDFCPQDYALLMTQCWATDPDARPDFGEIQQRLTGLRKAHGEDRHRISLVPDLQALKEAHQFDVDHARREGSRSGLSSSRLASARASSPRAPHAGEAAEAAAAGEHPGLTAPSAASAGEPGAAAVLGSTSRHRESVPRAAALADPKGGRAQQGAPGGGTAVAAPGPA
ncbi:hypothetical protein FNF27_03254 [Cafeteria roenbergensis]|uniref:Protein kinase domain-containing protein n=1 Tax=Cafeteria roenbergensis TaxID=33653 RepID=A0A5A8CJ48_CAFRO|nr:hypothetical protein FNF29_04277 [Cafeteria roenbergensis]KAA0175246.1 hypothetical protein FNF27_03254 [Cafeteria roenbergensis]|eukprot:KAA0151871.1 hypothetical protein FNF29_04277 [Cafeteria roenbergensis]